MPARLAQYLVARGLVSPEQAEQSLRKQAAEGGALDTALLEDELLSEPQLLEALGDISGQRPVNLADFEINHSVASLIPPKIAARLGITPLSLENSVLHVACSYPVPARELREVGFLLGKELELWVALEVRIRQWLAGLYGLPLSSRHASLLTALKPESPEPTQVLEEEVTLEEALAREMVEQLATAVIEEPIPLDVKKGESRPARERGRGPIEPEDEVLRDFEDLPDWSLQQARDALKHAQHNPDRVLEVTLRFAERTFDFAAAFEVRRGMAHGREIRAPGWTKEDIQKILIPLDVLSVFRTVMLSRGSYVGPPPPDAFSGFFLQKLGRTPRTIFLFPVEAHGRVVVILYGDCGDLPISQRRMSDFLLFCQGLPSALYELAQPPEFERARPTRRSAEAAGRDQPAPAEQDFPALFAQLTGPDAAERAAAVEALIAASSVFAPKLIAQFPGPTSWSRGTISSIPDAAELGPIPAALVQMGAAGVTALAPLLDSVQLNTRYWAVLTAGSFPAPDFIDGLRRALFDHEPDVASAARAVAKRFGHLPQFELVLRDLRRDLTTREGNRCALAAKALGVLHDCETINALIGLVGSDDPESAQAAAGALTEITKASFGTSARQWTLWWAENRDRGREEWLVAGLRHSDLEIRSRSLEELIVLSGGVPDALGYRAEAPEAEREAAVQRWQALLGALERQKSDEVSVT